MRRRRGGNENMDGTSSHDGKASPIYRVFRVHTNSLQLGPLSVQVGPPFGPASRLDPPVVLRSTLSGTYATQPRSSNQLEERKEGLVISSLSLYRQKYNCVPGSRVRGDRMKDDSTEDEAKEPVGSPFIYMLVLNTRTREHANTLFADFA